MEYRLKIRLRDTDSTGVIYFPKQLEFTSEVLEHFMHEKGFSINKLFEMNLFMPVVHATSNYYHPLFLGDAILITMKRKPFGEKSLTLFYQIYKGEVLVGDATIKHVALDGNTKHSIELPSVLKELFASLPLV
jgi:1,4-dihydroxy-2-naphthoyl-CoA hydrolase